MSNPSSTVPEGLPVRPQAIALLEEWVQSDQLRRHCLAVEAAMRAYARERGGDEDLWGLTGLLHDLDYDRYPDLDTGHPRFAMETLASLGYPDELVRAVGSHADYMGLPRETEMELALAAVDELSGFILACAYVRPAGFDGLTARSVKKKMKQRSFAAAVDRDAMVGTAEAFGVEFGEHVEVVIAALAPHASRLLAGDSAKEP